MSSLANSSAAADPSAPAAGAPSLHIDAGAGMRCPPDLKHLLDPIAAAVHAATGMTGAVALRLTDDAEMARLNRTFAGRTSATDVLAFPNGDSGHPGDVAISFERVRAQADAYGHSIKREFGYLLTHALLHLAGLGHDDDEKQRAMRRAEESIMAAVGLDRACRPTG